MIKLTRKNKAPINSKPDTFTVLSIAELCVDTVRVLNENDGQYGVSQYYNQIRGPGEHLEPFLFEQFIGDTTLHISIYNLDND